MVPFLHLDRYKALIKILFSRDTAVAKDIIAAAGDCDVRVESFGVDRVLANDTKHLDGGTTIKQLQAVKEDKVDDGANECFARLQAPSLVVCYVVYN